MSTYQLIDEPRPGTLAHLTTDPMWPLLSYMLGSPFFAWGWYGLNSYAMGSPTKNREFLLIGLGVIGTFAWSIIVAAMKINAVVEEPHLPYLRLVFNIFTLTITYILYVCQSRPFEIFQYFDGKVMSGMPGLFLAIFLGKKFEHLIVTTVLGVIVP